MPNCDRRTDTEREAHEKTYTENDAYSIIHYTNQSLTMTIIQHEDNGVGKGS